MLRVAREAPVVATEEARHGTKYVVDGSIQALRYPGGKEFEVEFAAGHGDTVAVLTLPRGDIRPMEGREILHARPIERQSG